MQKESIRESLMPEAIATSIVGYLFILTFLAIFKSGIDYARSILTIDAACLAFWSVALVTRAIRRRQLPSKGRVSNIASAFLILVFVLYLGNVVWNKGYLNLFAVDTLLSSNSHIDSMFHSSIAEAIKNYHVPSILVNDTRYLAYHYGSHVLFAILASAFGMPAFIVYNYLYPVVFFPIFFYIIICLALEVKKINKVTPVISTIDLIILFVGLVGIFPVSVLGKMGIGYWPVFISESFLIGMIALFTFLLLAARGMSRGKFQIKAFVVFYAAVLVPVFILICSACKLSIGFLLFVGCSYYVFRKSPWKRARYLLVLLYCLVFIACFRAFSGTVNSSFRPLDFLRQYVEGSLWIWYFVIAYLFTLIFIYSGIHEKRDLVAAIKRGELIEEETLLIVSIAGALPGLVLSIPGGSAAYFSMVQGFLVLPFLIGSERLKLGRGLPAFIAYLLLAVNLFDANSFLFIKKVAMERVTRSELSPGKGRKNALFDKLRNGKIIDAFTMLADLYFSPIKTDKYIGFKSQLDYVNELTRDSKRQTAVFLAPESQLWNVQKDSRASPFFIPCYTGLVLINAVHSDGKTLYDGGGGTIGDVQALINYGLDPFKKAPEMDLSRCIEAGKREGFKRLIVIDKDVHVVGLSNGS